MCEEQKATGSFRETADQVLGGPNPYPQSMGSTPNRAYEDGRQLSRIKQLEERVLSDERLFQTFAKLAQKGKVYRLTFVVFDPQGLHPASSATIMTEYGPYSLLELLQRYDQLRQFKHWHVRIRDVTMLEQAV